jgi:alkanesulfonate monooxygenase SsuD/methylene tetrahydromethanopterin reductase-like flavin-dependent oxidoreductase (luciferase family)
MNSRFGRFEEGLECVSRLLKSNEPITFAGKYYQLHDAQILPHPIRKNGPHILVGGNGLKRTLPLAARFANEWNANFLLPDQFMNANQHLDALLSAEGRSPGSIRRSLMTGCVFARDEAGLNKKLAARGRTKAELRERGILAGTGQEFLGQIKKLSEAGVQRVMLQWLDLDDLEGLKELAKAVL